MAKVIRDQWVYKRNDRWWRHLPRRGDDHPKMSWADEDIHQTISTFPEPMQSKPPKLWIAWLYREWSGRTHGPKVRDHIKALFGHQAKPGIFCHKLNFTISFLNRL